MKHLKLIVASLILSYNSFGQACSQINTVTVKTLNSCNQTGTGHTNLNTLYVTQITGVGSFVGIDNLIDTNYFQLKSSANTKFFLKPLGTGSQYIDGTGALKTLPLGYTFTGLGTQVTTGTGSYITLATVANTGNYSDLTGKPTLLSSFTNDVPFVTITLPTALASGARNFNQAYQLSTTRPSKISVSSQLSCNLSLSGGQSGTVVLEISANGTSGWVYSGQLSGSNTGTLTIGLNTTQISGGQLSEDLPTGYYWRLRTTNVTGTPTYTFNGGSEKVY